MKLVFSAAAFVAIILSLCAPASAQSVIFNDNFDGVPDGSLLSSQAGWSDDFGGMEINSEQAEGTAFQDQENQSIRTWSGQISGAHPQYVLGMNMIQASNNFVLRVRAGAGGSIGNLTLLRDNGGQLEGAAGGDAFSFSGIPTPTGPLDVEWTIDTSDFTISQTIDDGINAPFTWGPTTLAGVGTLSSVTQIDNLRVGSDTRGAATGIIFDNLKLEAIPEPSSFVLLAIGLLTVCSIRRRR